MSRTQEPFTVNKRTNAKTFLFSLNPGCGLPANICQSWQRKSFMHFPAELAQYRYPKSISAAKSAVLELIRFLLRTETNYVEPDTTTAGEWLAKFTSLDGNPRALRNNARNRPYSPDTVRGYEEYYRLYIKADIFSRLKMTDVSDADALAFAGRLAKKKMRNGRELGGTRTFEGVIKFVRMAFTEYRKTHRGWINPFSYIDPPYVVRNKPGCALTESEVVSLFKPGVLLDTMERAVCSVMFLLGARRSEIFALKPQDLDWKTPRIHIRRAWQNFDRKNRVMGPTKGKKERVASFPPALQSAIAALWKEEGQHEFVFSWRDGSTPGPSWIKCHFTQWLKRAGINAAGRRIVPHSARHSLASMLEARGVPLRYIQEFLSHEDLQTTKLYLHAGEDALDGIGGAIEGAMGGGKFRALKLDRELVSVN